MTEVRIRFDYEVASKRIADVPFDQLDSVIPTLERWGGVTAMDEVYESEFAGQFVMDESGAYFEVLICGEPT